MKLLFKTDPAARIRIEDAPPVPRINPAQSVKDAYDKLKPISRRTSVALRGEFTPSGKMVTNWRKLLEHDAIVAMHHRLISLDPEGYGAGRIDSFTGVGPKITGSVSERSNRLLQELQGMARYAQSRRLGRRYPWGWQTPPGEGHEYGDRFMYHGTPSAWTGPFDPRKIRPQDQPAGYGVLGMYMTSQRKMAEGYRDPNRIQRRGAMAATQPTVQRWQLPRREDRFERFLPMGWNEDHVFHPEVKERLKRWYLDMCRRHLGRIPDMSAITDPNDDGYSASHLMMIDIPAMVRAFEQRYGPNIDKIHNLQNHLQTMALTAAGYDGVRWIDSDHRGVVQGSEEGNTYSVLPVAWNKIRRVGDTKKRGPRDRTEEPEYDEMYPKPSEYTYVPPPDVVSPSGPRASSHRDIKGGPINYMMNSFSESYFSMRKAKAPWNPDERIDPNSSMGWVLPNKKIGWRGVPSPENFIQMVIANNPGVTRKKAENFYWELLTSGARPESFYEQYLQVVGNHEWAKRGSSPISEIQRRRSARESEREATQSRRNQIDRTLRNVYWSVAPLHYQAWGKASPEIRKQLMEAAPHTFLPLQEGNSVDDEQNDDSPFWNYLVHYRGNASSPYGDGTNSIFEKIDTIKNMEDEKDISKEKIHNLVTAMGDRKNRLDEQSYWDFISKTLPSQHKKLQELLQKHNLLSPQELERHNHYMNQAVQWFAIPSPEQSLFESTGEFPDKIRIGAPRRMDDSPAEPPPSQPRPETPAQQTRRMLGETTQRSFAASYFSMRKAKAPWSPNEELHPSMQWTLPDQEVGWNGIPTLDQYREIQASSGNGFSDKKVQDLYWKMMPTWWRQYKNTLRQHNGVYLSDDEQYERDRERAFQQSQGPEALKRKDDIKKQIRTLVDTVAKHHWNAWQKATPEMREAMQKIAPHTLLVDGDEPFWKYLEEFRHQGLNPYADRYIVPEEMIDHKIDALREIEDASPEKKERLFREMGSTDREHHVTNLNTYWNFVGRVLPQQHQTLSKFMQQHNLLSPQELQDHDDALHQATQWFAMPSNEQEAFERTGKTPDKIGIGTHRGVIDTTPAEPPSPVSSSPIPRTTAPATDARGARTGEAENRLAEWHRLQRSLFPFAIWPNRDNIK